MAATVEINADRPSEQGDAGKIRQKFVTAVTFDPQRLVFGDFEAKPVGKGKDTTTFEHIPIKYRYTDDPNEDPTTLKWGSPHMVSPRGFETRDQNGKTEWSFMVVYDPNEDADWDDETLKKMEVDPDYKKRKMEEWAQAVEENRQALNDEIAAQKELTDAAIAHIEFLQNAKKGKSKKPMCIQNFSAKSFSRLPFAKNEDDAAANKYTAWMKLMNIPGDKTRTGKSVTATVFWDDGERIPKVKSKDDEDSFVWADLMGRRLVTETLYSVREIYFGKVNKIQTSALSVMIHSVKEAERFDPLQTKAKANAADKEKAQYASRNKARLLLLKAAGPAVTEENVDKPINLAGSDDDGAEDEALRREQKAAAPKRAPVRVVGNSGAPPKATARVPISYGRQPLPTDDESGGKSDCEEDEQ